MTWFKDPVTLDSTSLTLIHITDSHVFKELTGHYFTVNTASNLLRALEVIASIPCDAVIFGGDLTQDHSVESYHLFAKLVKQVGLQNKCYWVPGNHDDIEVYQAVFSEYGIAHQKVIENQTWQVLLANSKSKTPAGYIADSHLNSLHTEIEKRAKHTVVFTHHHPLPINGYLDKHILENGPELLDMCHRVGHVKALFHGHVHNEYAWHFEQLSVFATPATSIQFEKNTPQWQQIDLGPAFRMIRLNPNGSINTQVVWLDNV